MKNEVKMLVDIAGWRRQLAENQWAEHPEYAATDWKLLVANGDTRLGYAEWVEHRIEEYYDNER